MNSNHAPEILTLKLQIQDAEKLVLAISKQLKAKTAELDRNIQNDNSDLFGERKSEPAGVNLLFSERVNPQQREFILNPIKQSLKTAENQLQILKSKQNIPVTGKLF